MKFFLSFVFFVSFNAFAQKPILLKEPKTFILTETLKALKGDYSNRNLATQKLEYVFVWQDKRVIRLLVRIADTLKTIPRSFVRFNTVFPPSDSANRPLSYDDNVVIERMNQYNKRYNPKAHIVNVKNMQDASHEYAACRPCYVNNLPIVISVNKGLYLVKPYQITIYEKGTDTLPQFNEAFNFYMLEQSLLDKAFNYENSRPESLLERLHMYLEGTTLEHVWDEAYFNNIHQAVSPKFFIKDPYAQYGPAYERALHMRSNDFLRYTYTSTNKYYDSLFGGRHKDAFPKSQDAAFFIGYNFFSQIMPLGSTHLYKFRNTSPDSYATPTERWQMLIPGVGFYCQNAGFYPNGFYYYPDITDSSLLINHQTVADYFKQSN